ncbi:MAG: hypothetical protein ACP5PV_09765 [Methanothrix sp.]
MRPDYSIAVLGQRDFDFITLTHQGLLAGEIIGHVLLAIYEENNVSRLIEIACRSEIIFEIALSLLQENGIIISLRV